jgi:hypothetical protein
VRLTRSWVVRVVQIMLDGISSVMIKLLNVVLEGTSPPKVTTLPVSR